MLGWFHRALESFLNILVVEGAKWFANNFYIVKLVDKKPKCCSFITIMAMKPNFTKKKKRKVQGLLFGIKNTPILLTF